MKNILLFILSLVCCCVSGYFAIYIRHDYHILLLFILGCIAGITFALISINNQNKKISSYKRELEKESISSDENSSKVKVLESKIAVLEKALENALKK